MIDTEIDGSPAALRRAACYLRDALAAGVTSVADESVRQRRQLQDVWHGRAGEAFRDRSRTLATTADEAAGASLALALELDALADVLQEAQEALVEVRRLARRLGLRVEGYVIHEQLPFPTQPGETHTSALDAWLGLGDEYRRCEDLAQRWLGGWDRARCAFETRVASNLATLVQATTSLLVTGYSTWLLHRLGGVLAGESAHLWGEAAKYAARGDELTDQLRRGTVPATPQVMATIDDYRGESARAAAAAEAIPGRPVLPPGLVLGLEGFNVAAAGYGVYADVQDGESTGQALASQGGGLFAGVVASALTAAAFASPSTPLGSAAVFVGVAAVGIGMSIFTDQQVDKFLESRQEKGHPQTRDRDAARREREERRVAGLLATR